MTGVRALRRASLLVLCLGSAACLPIRVTYRDSPPLTGIYRAADGTPVAGGRVFVAGGFSRSGCEKPRVEARTDLSGRFRLAESKHVEKYIVLLPIDRFTAYTLCLPAGDSVWTAYRSASLGMAPASGGRLDCFQWRNAAGALRATCGNQSDGAFARGGEWRAADGVAGHYRLLTAIDPDDGTRLLTIVQWIPGSLAHPAPNARATVDLNAASGLFGLTDADLENVDGHWRVRARGTEKVGKPYVHHVVLELGAPGEVKVLSDECRSNPLRELLAAKLSCP
jgi:hypothetical protein